MSKEILLLDKTESFLESLASDVMTTILIGFCVYISLGSTWWTFVTGLMFILIIFVKITSSIKKRSYEFKSYTELKEYAEKQEKI